MTTTPNPTAEQPGCSNPKCPLRRAHSGPCAPEGWAPDPTAGIATEAIVAKALRDSWSDELEYTDAPEAITAALRAHGLLSEGAPSAEQVEAAAKALRDDKANRTDTYRVPEWEDMPYGDKLVYRGQARAALAAAGVDPQEKVNGLDVHEWAQIARAKDEANEAAVSAIDDLAHAIRLTVEYIGNDWLPPAEGWSWFDALMRHRPELAQPFVEKPILLRPEGAPAGALAPVNGKWVCGKCAREAARGEDDGQIPEHHRTCPKWKEAADHEKLIAEADVWLKTMNSQHSDSLVRDLRDALAAPLDPEKVAEVLDGNHFIEHGPGYGEHLALTPEACRHFARAICEAAKRGELT